MYGMGTDVPLLLVGAPGTGKTSILAKIADLATSKVQAGLISG